jgi:hypothetical protein
LSQSLDKDGIFDVIFLVVEQKRLILVGKDIKLQSAYF